MAEARRRDEWERVSFLMCAIAEPNRDRKHHPEPFTPSEFNPFLRGKSRPQRKENRHFVGNDFSAVRLAWGL